MKYLIFLFYFSAFSVVSIAQYVGLNSKEISSLKKLIKNDSSVANLYKPLKQTADAALNDKPNPIDTVISEGHLATDPKKIITVISLRDIEKIYALSFAYKLDGDISYLNKLSEFLLAWANTNQPQGNPINDTKFENLLFAYDMVKTDITKSQKQRIDEWLVKMADEEIRTGSNKAKTTSFNNWNSHRLKVVGLIAYMLDNATYKKHTEEQLPIQIEKNLLPDGSGFDFMERDALHYHVYTLEPLISLATVIKRANGKDYYNYVSSSGSSIKKSVEFLVPYFTGEKTHGEYVNSKVAFDKKRADNKEAGFEIGANFKPVHAIPVMLEAAYFDPSIMETVKIVMHTKSVYPAWHAVINKVIR